MASIHPTAIVDPAAKIGEGVEIGPYAVIGPEVSLGARTVVQSHAIVDGNTFIGEDCQIFPFAHIGGKTQDLKFREGNKTYVKVGDRTVLREYVTINCGTKDGESTILGSDCLIMAYCHLAHGCVFGNHVIVSNSSQFAGEVSVGDWAVVSGLVGAHQFVRIGAHAMIGGGSLLKQDAAPYFITDGTEAKARGINVVGLTRRGFPAETIAALRTAFKFLCHDGLNVTDAVAKIRAELPDIPELRELTEFFETTKRGVIR